MRPLHVRMAAIGLLSVLVAAGCAAPGTGPTEEPSPTPDTTLEPSPSPEPSPPPSPSPTATPLAGEPYDGPPLHGQPAALAVIGVAAGDVLNVRAGPGTDHEVVAALAPHATDVTATGRGRLLPGSIWLELTVEGGTGWSNSSFLAHVGPTRDLTSQVVDQLGGRPRGETMVDLAVLVAELRASDDPPSRIVVSENPAVGDLGEVTVDVVGLGDDAQVGERLTVFGTPDQDGGFTLRTVEATALCGRGASPEGCV